MSRKLTMEEVKEKLLKIDKDIIIIDEIYHSNRTKLNLICLVCDYEFKKTWDSISNQKQGCPCCGKNREKVSKYYIKSFVAKYGYEIVEFIENNNRSGTVFKVRCNSGHEFTTNYRLFIKEETKKSGACRECNQRNKRESLLNDQETVVKNIKDRGYSLPKYFIYEGNKKSYEFICEIGHIRFASYQDIMSQPDCPKCNGFVSKYTEEEIEKSLSSIGLVYLGGFVKTGEPIEYKCDCGNSSKGYYFSLMKGVRCKKCTGRNYWSHDSVKEFLKSKGCELLSDRYSRASDVIKFICSCGRKGEKRFGDFIYSPQCSKCGLEKRSGENHPDWNPTLTEDERKKNRKHPEYKEWRIKVYERDNYTCQCCGDNKGHNLVAHHLNSHDWAKGERTDVDNGLTLCDICHTDYHNIYGYGDNTKDQFDEYLEELYSDNLSTPS